MKLNIKNRDKSIILELLHTTAIYPYSLPVGAINYKALLSESLYIKDILSIPLNLNFSDDILDLSFYKEIYGAKVEPLLNLLFIVCVPQYLASLEPEKQKILLDIDPESITFQEAFKGSGHSLEVILLGLHKTRVTLEDIPYSLRQQSQNYIDLEGSTGLFGYRLPPEN